MLRDFGPEVEALRKPLEPPRDVAVPGEWDHSLFINSPGQSSDPASLHYSDLFLPWARDEAVPLLYSRPKVEAAAEGPIVLEPTGR